MINMRKDSTEIQYLRKGHLIYLQDGMEEYRNFFWMKKERPKYSLFEIIAYGDRFGATMEFTLQNPETLEIRTINVSPNRWVTYYTKETF